jgi:hypothetical protein
MTQKKTPFIYRSLAHFYLIYILPTSILFILINAFFNEKSSPLEHLQSSGTWIGFLAFQVVFGTLMYFLEYKPRIKKFKENA